MPLSKSKYIQRAQGVWPMRTVLGFDIVVTKRMSTKVKMEMSSSRGCHRCQAKTKFL